MSVKKGGVKYNEHTFVIIIKVDIRSTRTNENLKLNCFL